MSGTDPRNEPGASTSPRDAALVADRAGDLDRARDIVVTWNHSLAVEGDLGDLAESFRLKAKILRHRQDPAVLDEAVDAAEQAMRLMTARPLARRTLPRLLTELELASCLLDLGESAAAVRMLGPLLGHELVPASGWAWVLRAQSHLREDEPIRAVAGLHNAIAEFARSGHQFRERTARVSLAEALDRVGRVNDAHRLLQEERPFWITGDPALRRIAIRFRLVAAANHAGRGEIAEALQDLVMAAQELDRCTGLERHRIQLETLRAGCFREWGQRDLAEDAAKKAEALSRPFITQEPSAWRPASVPGPKAPVRLGTQLPSDGAPAGAGRRPSSSGFAARPAGPTGHRLNAFRYASNHEATPHAPDPPAMADRFLVTDRVGILEVVSAAESMAGVPGRDRQETRTLFRAADIIRRSHARGLFGSADDAQLATLWAERLYRRCLVRLTRLPHVEVLRGRAEIGLAQVLAGAGREEEALQLVVSGLRALDEERFEMLRRDYRNNWLRAELHPAYELGFRLAADRDPALAADLIVFSRNAGIVLPGLGGHDPTEIPLMPMPRLTYIDGQVSTLGSGGHCRFS